MQQPGGQHEAHKRLQQLQLTDRGNAAQRQPRYQKMKPIIMLNSET